MSHYVMQYTWYLIIFFCIDQGDGQWKERERNSLRHDIELYRKLAERIEHEIEAFYDDNPEDSFNRDSVDRLKLKKMTTVPNITTVSETTVHPYKKILSFNYGTPKSTTLKHEVMSSHEQKSPMSEWPKFEEILLEMGKKYDWSKDKWMKINSKRKIKTNVANNNKLDNSLEHNDKHKFKYRIVKLKSKNRRSVVVAVSAVR